MRRRFLIMLFSGSFLFFSLTLLSQEQSELSVPDIVKKNIESAGGMENLSLIKNYSFRLGPTVVYMSDDGLMKIRKGKEPVITEVITVEGDSVRKNCFNRISELSGIEKSINQSLARLRCGLFTLKNFKDMMRFEGLKSFGAKKHYLLSADVGELRVEFYLDSDEFLLRRLVFKGFDPAQGKYEANHDFGPYERVDGVKMPFSWFASQVGTRGQTFEVVDVQTNQPLDKDFFRRLDVEVGEVTVGRGEMAGNIVESRFQRGMLVIATNWTDECLRSAGFTPNDKLILGLSDQTIEIDLYEVLPPRQQIGPGSKFMAPNPESENYLIYLISPEFEQLVEKIEPLLPIQVKRKTEK